MKQHEFDAFFTTTITPHVAMGAVMPPRDPMKTRTTKRTTKRRMTPTNRQSYASRTKTRLLPGAKLGGRSQGSELGRSAENCKVERIGA